MKRRSRKYQVGGGFGQGQPNPMQPNQGGFNQMQPMMNPAMDPIANAQANQMYMNSITNQAQNLVNQGMFKDTRRGNRRAMRAAMRQANPGQGARNFANVMGGFGSVLGSVAPIMGGAAQIMNAKRGSSQPMIPGQFQRGGSLSPSFMGRAMAKAIERARKIREMDRRDAMREKELLNPQGFNPDGTPKVGPISSNRFEGGRLPDKVGPISSRRFEGGLLPPGVTVEDMKRRGGAKRKVATKSNRGSVIGEFDKYFKTKQNQGVTPGSGTKQRVQQMKHGGSMCRGLPGGPNEFPM